jgi:hypothetical protein
MYTYYKSWYQRFPVTLHGALDTKYEWKMWVGGKKGRRGRKGRRENLPLRKNWAVLCFEQV